LTLGRGRSTAAGGILTGVDIISPAPRDAWRDVLGKDSYALPTQTPEWTDWLCNSRGYSDTSRLYVFPDGRRLVLPLVARSVAGVRATQESFPYGFGYGGPLVPGGRPTEDEVHAIISDLGRLRVARTTLAANPLTAGTWSAAAPPGTVTVPYTSHVLSLEGGFDRVWSTRYRQEARRSVRRAIKNSLDVRQSSDSETIDVFADLNRRSVDRWAEQRGQPSWVARMVEERRNRAGQFASAIASLGSMVVAWTAHSQGQPVAAYIALVFGPTAYMWMSAMDKRLSDETRAGALLQSLAIEHACAMGAQWFNLGDAEAGSGVADFKERFGATPIHWMALRFERLPLTVVEHRLRTGVNRLASLPRARSERPRGGADPAG